MLNHDWNNSPFYDNDGENKKTKKRLACQKYYTLYYHSILITTLPLLSLTYYGCRHSNQCFLFNRKDEMNEDKRMTTIRVGQ